MRDFERLEELSSTVRSGLEANEVIWAIDQALAEVELDDEAKRSLAQASSILEALAEADVADQSPTARRSQSMLGSEGRASIRSVVVLAADAGEDEERLNVFLSSLTKALKAVESGEPPSNHRANLEEALELFAMISEVKLGRANGIIRARKERTPWLPRTTISSSS